MPKKGIVFALIIVGIFLTISCSANNVNKKKLIIP